MKRIIQFYDIVDTQSEGYKRLRDDIALGRLSNLTAVTPTISNGKITELTFNYTGGVALHNEFIIYGFVNPTSDEQLVEWASGKPYKQCLNKASTFTVNCSNSNLFCIIYPSLFFQEIQLNAHSNFWDLDTPVLTKVDDYHYQYTWTLDDPFNAHWCQTGNFNLLTQLMQTCQHEDKADFAALAKLLGLSLVIHPMFKRPKNTHIKRPKVLRRPEYCRHLAALNYFPPYMHSLSDYRLGLDKWDAKQYPQDFDVSKDDRSKYTSLLLTQSTTTWRIYTNSRTWGNLTNIIMQDSIRLINTTYNLNNREYYMYISYCYELHTDILNSEEWEQLVPILTQLNILGVHNYYIQYFADIKLITWQNKVVDHISNYKAPIVRYDETKRELSFLTGVTLSDRDDRWFLQLLKYNTAQHSFQPYQKSVALTFRNNDQNLAEAITSISTWPRNLGCVLYQTGERCAYWFVPAQNIEIQKTYCLHAIDIPVFKFTCTRRGRDIDLTPYYIPEKKWSVQFSLCHRNGTLVTSKTIEITSLQTIHLTAYFPNYLKDDFITVEPVAYESSINLILQNLENKVNYYEISPTQAQIDSDIGSNILMHTRKHVLY